MTTFGIRQDYDIKAKEGVILIDIKSQNTIVKQMRVAGMLDLEIELCALGNYSEEYSFGQAFAEGLFDGSLTKEQAAKMAETLKSNPRATVSVLTSNFIN